MMILKTISRTTGSKQQRWFTSQSNQLILAPCYLWLPLRTFDLGSKRAAENIYHLQHFRFRVRGTCRQLQIFPPILQEWMWNLVARWRYCLSSVCYMTARAALARGTHASYMLSITKKSILHNPVPLRPINGRTLISAVKLSFHVNHSNTSICFFCTVDTAGMREDDIKQQICVEKEKLM